MQDYTHLSMRERCLLTTFLSMKLSISEIAKKMGRHRSTLYRELERNLTYGCYVPGSAHEKAKKRHPKAPNKLERDKDLNEYVMERLKQGWTPEQISGRMRLENKPYYVCSESIYRYIYQNKELGLYTLLVSKQTKRYSRQQRKSYLNRQCIAKRNISYRPEDANLRKELGHWEGDTIRFKKGQKKCITTLVERKSRYVCLLKNKNKESDRVVNHMCKRIKLAPKKIWNTVTLDQGSEFMAFRMIERQTKTKVYFCDTHSPWQKGSNENMNGRLRRYLPKTCKIDKVSQDYLNRLARLVNNTPRKCLGFYTPAEIMKQHWHSFCRTRL